MYYVSYDKPNEISDSLMDKMVLFASEFLEIDECIEVNFDGDFADDCAGYALYDEEEQECAVYINPHQSKEEIARTFFHEMVHIKQYLNGELISGVGNRPSRWMGEEYDTTYYESPWEQEAYEHEEAMISIFTSTIDILLESV